MVALRFSLASLLFVVAVTGCNTLSDQQQLTLTQGEQAFRNKDYAGATRQLSTFLAESKDRPEAARALYVRGMAYALSGHRAEAYTDLRAAARASTDPQLTWQPAAVLGILFFEDENWDAAAQLLSAATTRMPAAAPMDALLFRTGVCYERMGRWAAAQTPFRRIVSQFPGGPYAANAERRVQLQADHFAIQCGVYSRSENANELVATLRQSGLSPSVSVEQRRGTPCYVVLEGRYASYQQANQALARIRGSVPDAVLWP